MKPLGDKIVVVPIEATDRNDGLIIPENYQQGLRTHFRARVLFTGPACVLAKPGCVVHIKETFGERIIYQGEKMLVGRERDINGVLPDEPTLEQIENRLASVN